jgi:hypothetical protein
MGYIRDGEGIMNNCRRKKKKIGRGKKKKKIEFFCPSSIRKCVVNKERWVGSQMLGQRRTRCTDTVTQRKRGEREIDAM